ncbi:hypothetical protein SORBI_3001G307100 [Sorghum bicolor]|uniref:Uncharacterized protein n=1 Tax=Sorghum bicolor TaxID=4558 RepID=A0A1B6QM48_SORBI|nr:hypothetical protein SORBI_3001G307100 [Sorghum bicolor]
MMRLPPPPCDCLRPSSVHCLHLGVGAPSCADAPQAGPSQPVASTACA